MQLLKSTQAYYNIEQILTSKMANYHVVEEHSLNQTTIPVVNLKSSKISRFFLQNLKPSKALKVNFNTKPRMALVKSLFEEA